MFRGSRRGYIVGLARTPGPIDFTVHPEPSPGSQPRVHPDTDDPARDPCTARWRTRLRREESLMSDHPQKISVSVKAVVVRAGRVLAVRYNDPFVHYNLPGGRLFDGETLYE